MAERDPRYYEDDDDEVECNCCGKVKEEEGLVRVQFFRDKKPVRVDRLPTTDISAAANEKDISVQPNSFRSFFPKSRETFNAKILQFHKDDGTYDVQYLEDLRGISDQLARRVPSKNIHDRPVAIQEFIFAILLSVINFVSDLYYIAFVSYKYEILRWISLGLLVLPVLTFIALDPTSYASLNFVQWFWRIATQISELVWTWIESMMGRAISEKEISERFQKFGSGLYVKSFQSKFSYYSNRKSRQLLILPVTFLLDSLIYLSFKSTYFSVALLFASLRVLDSLLSFIYIFVSSLGGWLRCLFFLPKHDGEIDVEIKSRGLITGCVINVNKKHGLCMVRWELKKEPFFIDTFHSFDELSATKKNMLSEREIIVPSDKDVEPETLHLQDTIPSKQESWKDAESDLSIGDKVHQLLGNLTITSVSQEDGVDATVIGEAHEGELTLTEKELVQTKIVERGVVVLKRTGMFSSAFLQRTIFDEPLMSAFFPNGKDIAERKPFAEIRFVLQQHLKLLYYDTVLNYAEWSDPRVFLPLPISLLFYIGTVFIIVTGLALTALSYSFMKIVMFIFRILGQLVVYPALHVLNFLLIVALTIFGIVATVASFTISSLSTLVVTVFCIHLKLFGFPVAGKAFFTKQKDASKIPTEAPVISEVNAAPVVALEAKEVEAVEIDSTQKCEAVLPTSPITVCLEIIWPEHPQVEELSLPKGKYLVDEDHNLDPNIKALNRSLFTELLFESIPQLIVSCLNAYFSGGASSTAFIVTVVSSGVTLLYNSWPYGYFIFYNDRFTSSEWKNATYKFCSLKRITDFTFSEISYRINRTPRFNVADMEVFTTGDESCDLHLYAGLMMMVVSSVFLTFGLQTLLLLNAPLQLSYFLLACFGACVGAAIMLFIKCSPGKQRPIDHDFIKKIMAFVGSVWSATSHFLFSWAFAISAVLFFACLDGNSMVPTVLTAFAPVLLVAVLHFASTFVLLLNDFIEYINATERHFLGLKSMLYFPFNYALFSTFIALVAYKMDYPVESDWIPWRGVAAVLWGLLTTGICANSAQFDGFTDFLMPDPFDFFGNVQMLAYRLSVSPVNPYACLYFALGIPFAVGFSIYCWAMDTGLSLPSYSYFLCSQIWATFASSAFFISLINGTGGYNIISGGDRESIILLSAGLAGICWWQSMLLSFVVARTYEAVSSYSLVMIPSYLHLFLISFYHRVEWLQVSNCFASHRYVKNLLVPTADKMSGSQSFYNGIFQTLVVLFLSSIAPAFTTAFLVACCCGAVIGGLALAAYPMLPFTNHALFTLSFTISTILFFAYLDGYSLVPTCLTAFAPMFLNLLMGMLSAVFVLLRSIYKKSSGGIFFAILFLFFDLLWGLFLAAAAYKLDYPVEAAWIPWRGIAGLGWGTVLCGMLSATIPDTGPGSMRYFEAYPSTRCYFTFGVPFAIGFSIFAWKMDVGENLPFYSFFLMSQIWIPLSSVIDFVVFLNEERFGNFVLCVYAMFLSWWQSMLLVFVHEKTYAEVSSYSLVLIPTYLSLFGTSAEHLAQGIHTWDRFYTHFFPPSEYA